MLLANKNALVFAATGAIAQQVARRFAQEGATLWLSARHESALEPIAEGIRTLGGTVYTHRVDACDPDAVAEYVQKVATLTGQIDVVFNGIGGRPAELGYPALSTTQSLDDFFKPLQVILGSTFLTSRTVGAYMIQQGSGAIVTLSATLTGMTVPHMAGITATCGAIEALTRSLAGEFGPHGIRVNCVRGSAMPETRTIQETGAGQVRLITELGGTPPPMALEATPLLRPITVGETAATAAFLASDLASGITGQVITVCAGAFVG
jgi:NAD(P)-dependent dehydrogenase (short-subunit alcohol dehydrogenase family)